MRSSEIAALLREPGGGGSILNVASVTAETGSDEEQTRCLGVIPAEVRRLPQSADLPVPQMVVSRSIHRDNSWPGCA